MRDKLVDEFKKDGRIVYDERYFRDRNGVDEYVSACPITKVALHAFSFPGTINLPSDERSEGWVTSWFWWLAAGYKSLERETQRKVAQETWLVAVDVVNALDLPEEAKQKVIAALAAKGGVEWELRKRNSAVLSSLPASNTSTS